MADETLVFVRPHVDAVLMCSTACLCPAVEVKEALAADMTDAVAGATVKTGTEAFATAGPPSQELRPVAMRLSPRITPSRALQV